MAPKETLKATSRHEKKARQKRILYRLVQGCQMRHGKHATLSSENAGATGSKQLLTAMGVSDFDNLALQLQPLPAEEKGWATV